MSKKTINKVYYACYLLITVLAAFCNYSRDTDRKVSKPVMGVITALAFLAIPVYLVFAGMKLKMILDKRDAEDCDGCAELTEAEEWL